MAVGARSWTTASAAAGRTLALSRPSIGFWWLLLLTTLLGGSLARVLSEHFAHDRAVLVAIAALAAVVTLDQRHVGRTWATFWLTVVSTATLGTLAVDTVDVNGVPGTRSWFVLLVALSVLVLGAVRVVRRAGVDPRLAFWLTALAGVCAGTVLADLATTAGGLGSASAALMAALALVATALAHFLGLDTVVSFWTAWVLVRTVSACLSDYLSAGSDDGNLALSAVKVSIGAAAGAVALAWFLRSSRQRGREPIEP